jgi:predicted transcriptional regulator of viral defense system
MKNNGENFRLDDWVNEQISFGKYSFSRDTLVKAFSAHSQDALKLSLNRLSRKGKIVSVHKDYYVIVSPEYVSRGILPPALFIDNLMNYLKRPYYVGLLNAAAFYGASHQSPQESFVFTNFPVMRRTEKKGIRINYLSKTKISENYLEKRKTDTGFLNVSSPELTAVDIVQYQKRIGGLSRSAIILEELAESIRPEKITPDFLLEIPVSVIQRMGYLFEAVIENEEIAKIIYQRSLDTKLTFFPVPLDSAKTTRGFSGDNRWKIIKNIEVDLD